MDLDKKRKKDLSELQKDLKKKREKMADLFLKLKNGQLTNTSQVKKAKKDIARILTIIHEKQNV